MPIEAETKVSDCGGELGSVPSGKEGEWTCSGCTRCTGRESGVRTWEKDVMTLDKGIMVTCSTLDGIG